MDASVSAADFGALLSAAFYENGLSVPDPAASERFYRLYLFLEEENQKMNLTAIRGAADTVVRHFADCAAAAKHIPPGAAAADIGAGAGFPTLPLAILRQDLQILAVDSTAKRMDYVARAAAHLSLSNVKTHVGRAEEMGKDPAFRERFDVVTARAVARMNVLAEWCLPLCRVGGLFLSLKGKNGAEELAEARHAVSLLGGGKTEDEAYFLRDPFRPEDDPDHLGARHILKVTKTGRTPAQYPRKNGQITAKPL